MVIRLLSIVLFGAMLAVNEWPLDTCSWKILNGKLFQENPMSYQFPVL